MGKKTKYNMISGGEKEIMDDDYKKVIDLLVKKELEWKKICINLAKEYPDIFLQCAENTKQIVKTWQEQTIEYAKQYPNNKIQCIKFCREHSGLGLAEAKEFVDNNCVEYKIN